jgi:hypothetical protein
MRQAGADEEEATLRMERCRKRTKQAEKEIGRAEALARRATASLDRAEQTVAKNRAALEEA